MNTDTPKRFEDEHPEEAAYLQELFKRGVRLSLINDNLHILNPEYIKARQQNTQGFSLTRGKPLEGRIY